MMGLVLAQADEIVRLVVDRHELKTRTPVPEKFDAPRFDVHRSSTYGRECGGEGDPGVVGL